MSKILRTPSSRQNEFIVSMSNVITQSLWLESDFLKQTIYTFEYFGQCIRCPSYTRKSQIVTDISRTFVPHQNKSKIRHAHNISKYCKHSSRQVLRNTNIGDHWQWIVQEKSIKMITSRTDRYYLAKKIRTTRYRFLTLENNRV